MLQYRKFSDPCRQQAFASSKALTERISGCTSWVILQKYPQILKFRKARSVMLLVLTGSPFLTSATHLILLNRPSCTSTGPRALLRECVGAERPWLNVGGGGTVHWLGGWMCRGCRQLHFRVQKTTEAEVKRTCGEDFLAPSSLHPGQLGKSECACSSGFLHPGLVRTESP